jgi:hypothetical protein
MGVNRTGRKKPHRFRPTLPTLPTLPSVGVGYRFCRIAENRMMRIDGKDFDQFLGELGAPPNLNRLSGANYASARRRLKAGVESLAPGDHVAFFTPDGCRQELGLVAGNADGTITVATPGGSTVEFSSGTGKQMSIASGFAGKLATVVPVSGAHRRLADRLLRSTRLLPGRYAVDPAGEASIYVLSQMRREVAELGETLGFEHPGVVRHEAVGDRALSEIAETLPGSGDGMDDRRGYLGWGPYDEGAATLEVDGLDELFGVIIDNEFEVYDYSFHVAQDEVVCPCCSGGGKNRDFAELKRGFYGSGEGRWQGWGDDLAQQEIDVLVAENRISAPVGVAVTVANYKDHMRRFGHDEINRYLVAPIRAAALGISTADCHACNGAGLIAVSGKTLGLNLWLGDHASRIAIVVNLPDAPLERLGEIAAMMAAHGKMKVENLGLRAKDGHLPKADRFGDVDPVDRGLASDCVFSTWKDFASTFSDVDHHNLPMAVAYQAVGGDALSGKRMAMRVAHPRKGVMRTIFIDRIEESDQEAMTTYLEKAVAIHVGHFRWAFDACAAG